MNQQLLAQATPDNTHIVVSIPKQRAYLMIGEQIVADGPISSGKRGHETPRGHFSVMEKDPNHHSSLYGDFVDRSGRVVRAGVSAHIDSAPSGTHFAGAAMKWFLRLTGEGVGMHIGILAGLSGLARLRSRISRRREIVLRSRQSRHAGRCRRFLNQLSPQHFERDLRDELLERFAVARKK